MSRIAAVFPLLYAAFLAWLVWALHRRALRQARAVYAEQNEGETQASRRQDTNGGDHGE